MTTPNYSTRSFAVPANGSIELYREAEFLTCLEATGDFKIKIDNGPSFDFEAGLSISFDRAFTRLELIDVTGATNVVKIALGKGGVKDARLVLSGRIDTKPATPDVLTTGAPVAAAPGANTALAAANVQRKEAILANQGAGAVYVNGSAAAAAGQGVPVAAGAIMVLENAGPIYARNDTGAAVNVSVTQSEFAP